MRLEDLLGSIWNGQGLLPCILFESHPHEPVLVPSADFSISFCLWGAPFPAQYSHLEPSSVKPCSLPSMIKERHSNETSMWLSLRYSKCSCCYLKFWKVILMFIQEVFHFLFVNFNLHLVPFFSFFSFSIFVPKIRKFLYIDMIFQNEVCQHLSDDLH